MVDERTNEEKRKKKLMEEAARQGIPNLPSVDSEAEYLVWLGGFFDGEGCVSIPEAKKLTDYPFDYTLEVQIHGNFKEVLEEIQQRFEGNLYPTEGSEYSWRLCFSANKALRFLEAIKLYVRLKREEVEDGISFQRDKVKLVRGIPRSVRLAEMRRRELLAWRLHYLNQVRYLGERLDDETED